MDRRLARMSDEKWVGGVCAGIAYSLGIPTWIVRLITFLVIMRGLLIVYIILWIFMPRWKQTPEDYKQLNE
jgi:phage shock protein PspC (stress-responsive transcriptional regulator)